MLIDPPDTIPSGQKLNKKEVCRRLRVEEKQGDGLQESKVGML